VRYASKFQDGSIAAIVSLGRNYATGIKWAQVLRALCDVSLTKSSSVGKKKEVCMVDIAASPVRPHFPAFNNESIDCCLAEWHSLKTE